MTSLTIGQLAKAAGVGVETVRFYERTGVLEAPGRRPSGYRQFTADDARRIRFVKRAQQLGFTLKEVKELLALNDDPDADPAEVRAKAAAKVADIKAKVRDLLRVQAHLEELRDACPGHGPASGCPILHALAGDDGTASRPDEEDTPSPDNTRRRTRHATRR